MITRSSTLLSPPTLAKPREPLSEDIFSINRSASLNTTTSALSPSPKKPVARSLSSPARRLKPQRLSPARSLSHSTKRSLGSPVRLPAPQIKTPAARRNAVIPEYDEEDDDEIAQDSLRSPARRPKVVEHTNNTTTSPLKKPPTRLLAGLQPVKIEAVVIETTPKRHHTRSPKRSPPVQIRTMKQIELEAESLPSFTPIRTPPSPTKACSPPQDDTFENEDDLWLPSVPLTLTTSMSQLSLHEEPKKTIFIDIKAAESADLNLIATSLGANTVQRWNWNPDTQGTPRKPSKVTVTHVVYLNGSTRTLKKITAARKLGIDVKCTGLAWLRQSQQQGHFIPADGFEVDVVGELERMVGRIEVTLTPLIPPQTPVKKVYRVTEFERHNIVLARRSSTKFKPPISSPLAKACT